jgi:hypothetical protein
MRTVTTILGIIIVFGALWAGVQILIARVAGWTLLARAYRFSGTFRGVVWKCPTYKIIRMKWDGFEGALTASFPWLPRDIPDERFGYGGGELTVGANTEGLYLAQLFVFRPGHAPLFIPWRDIAVNRMSVGLVEELKKSFDQRFWPAEPSAPADSAGGSDDRVYLVFRFVKAPGVLLQLPESDGRRVAEAARSSWPGILQPRAIPSSQNE